MGLKGIGPRNLDGHKTLHKGIEGLPIQMRMIGYGNERGIRMLIWRRMGFQMVKGLDMKMRIGIVCQMKERVGRLDVLV